MNAPLWISEREVTELIDLPDAMAALEHGLRAEARGSAQNMVKTHLQWGASNLHALGGKLDDLVGTKTWAHTEGGTGPLLILFDAHDGSVQGVIEAFALGQLRTGGVSGVATRWLARADASELAVIGTGKQAIAQVAAVLAARPITTIRVFSPRAASREAFRSRLRLELETDCTLCDSAASAVAGAHVVTIVTRATSPIVDAPMLATGCHVNAVGAITPERQELDPGVFARVSLAVVDNVDSARKLSRELIDHYDRVGWESVRPLSAVVAAAVPRPADADVTLFKAMGMGLADLALGREVLARAHAAGVGRRLDARSKATPRFRTRALAT